MTDSPLTVAEIIAALAAVEHWRPIAGFPSYEVSSWGAVRRRERRAVKPTPLHGYMRVCLSERNRKSGRTVHRLVAAAFLGPPPFAGAMVAHNDGDRTNNRLDNLRWASALENQADRHRHGTRCSGSRVFGAKLTEADIPGVREAIASRRTYADIGAEYGVSASAVYMIANNRTWRHTVGGQERVAA